MKKLKGIDGKLDEAWAELVKLVAGHRCEFETDGVRCDKVSYYNAKGNLVGLQSHHFYSRSNRSVRWVVENGFCLCPSHHTLSSNSAHKAPADFVEWARKKRGEKWFDEIVKKKNQTYKPHKHEKEEWLLYLTERIKCFEE